MSVITDLIDENSSCNARIAELEARIVWLECEAQVNAAPVSEAKAQGSMLQKIGKRLAELLDEDQFAEVEQMLARLNAAPVQQVSVPDGWKLVPVELTREMAKAVGDLAERKWCYCLTAANVCEIFSTVLAAAPAAPAADAGIVDMYRHLQKVTPYRFKKIQDASITDGGDVMYFHKDRFDAALLADMAAHCAAPATADSDVLECGE